MIIGVLALQGAFIEHIKMLDKLNVNSFEIRDLNDLNKPMDGIILPGGESTTIGKLLKDLNMLEPLRKLILNGLPVFGTCAGMILLAKDLDNDQRSHLQTMDISVKRNAYGRQLGSFMIDDYFNDIKIPMVFIRAPYISSVSQNVKILATVNNNIVAAVQENQLVTSFHPELTNNTYVHQYFIDMCKDNKAR